MNERIKELDKQAGGHFSTHILTSYPAQRRESIELWDKNIEKFAELIVRECMEVVIDGQYSDTECEGNSHRISYNNGRYGASSDIKKHFGVEE